jgi:hypothetical protein
MRYSAESKLAPDKVVDLAAKYFTSEGAGLKVSSKDSSSLCMEALDGFVMVSTCKSDVKGRKTHLEIETREYDHQVTEFLRSV